MNKSIFVTGAASGIGKATALLFGRRGFTVGCYDVDVDGAEAVAKAVGRAATHGRLDVTNVESWKLAVADFEQRGSPQLDVLFNCAGILRMGRFEDVPPVECQRQLDVNVMGTILGIQTCLPALERARGTIVNMSSASAIYGQPELAVYSASKFAVRALTEALDIELAAKGVRVCDVMPGYVDTPMVREQRTPAASLKKMGVKLTAEGIADIVWEAAHGTGLHYIPQKELALAGRLGGLVPELGRAVMRRLGRA